LPLSCEDNVGSFRVQGSPAFAETGKIPARFRVQGTRYKVQGSGCRFVDAV